MADFFSSNLKYLRSKKGYSQSELGRKINVNQTTIARWEDDERTPTINYAIKCSDALKIPLEYLVGKDLEHEGLEDFETTMNIPIFESYKDYIENKIFKKIIIPINWFMKDSFIFGIQINGNNTINYLYDKDIIILERNNNIDDYINKDVLCINEKNKLYFAKIQTKDKNILLVPNNATLEVKICSIKDFFTVYNNTIIGIVRWIKKF